MSSYYDSGIVLKLYTPEKESQAVQDFVIRRGEPLNLNSLHLSECTSALKLKSFRGECDDDEANGAIADIEEDVQNGVIQMVGCDWDEVWHDCRLLARTYSSRTGCRTLDTLHVASALHLSCRELISTEERQIALAKAVGLKISRPFSKKRK